MFTKKLALVALAGTSLLAASSAFAHDGGHGHWKQGHRWHGYGHYPQRVVVMPAPRVYYTPPPVVYAPPRPVYAQPHPVYVQPHPVYVEPRPTIVYRQPGFSIGVGF
jgi:hypothetical protein